jgi:hypothetical protein
MNRRRIENVVGRRRLDKPPLVAGTIVDMKPTETSAAETQRPDSSRST